MCSLLCVCTREVEVGVRGQRGGGGGVGGGVGIKNFGKLDRLLMKGINGRQIPYQYSTTTAIKVPLGPVAD